MRKEGLSLACVALLAGCAAMPGAHRHAHGSDDPCAEYRATIAGKPIDEQRRAAEAHIVQRHGHADAAHVERHLKMMAQRCTGA